MEPADHLGIRVLLDRYLHAVDVRDLDLILSCFTPDVSLDYEQSPEPITGHAEARRYFGEKRAFSAMGIDVAASTHVLGNLHVTRERDEHRSVCAAVVFLSGVQDGREVLIQRGVSYTDDLEQQDREWRIRRRVHRTLWHRVLDVES